jgi:rare lipoprotein A
MSSSIKKMLKTTLSAIFSTLVLFPTNVFAQVSSCGYASHYGVGDGFHGNITANGEQYNAYGNTVAHKSLPFGTKLQVTNQRNGASVIVRVNDRGPYIHGRHLDLSYGAFSKIAPPSQGEVKVCYSVI